MTSLVEGPASFESADTANLPASFDSATQILAAERVIRREPQNSIAVLPFVNVSPVLTLAGRFDSALAEMDKISEIEPSFRGAHTSLGMIFSSRGEYDEAIDSLNRALELGGFATTVLSYKGVVQRFVVSRASE